MKTIVEPLKEEEKEVKRVAFQVIHGGGEGSMPWLQGLEVGTCFLFATRLKQGANDPQLGCDRATVIHKYPNQTLLLDNLNQERYYTVITDNFSNFMKLLYIIDIYRPPVEGVPPVKQEETDAGTTASE